MDDNICYRKFKEIMKTGGEDKYLYWKSWVEDELRGSSRKKIINMLKYYQIKYKMMEKEDEPKAVSIYIPLASMILSVITIVVTLVIASYNNLLSAFDKFSGLMSVEEYMKIVGDTLSSGLMSLLDYIMIPAIIIVGIVGLAYGMDYLRQKYSARRRVYLEEVISVLQKILENVKETPEQ